MTLRNANTLLPIRVLHSFETLFLPKISSFETPNLKKIDMIKIAYECLNNPSINLSPSCFVPYADIWASQISINLNYLHSDMSKFSLKDVEKTDLVAIPVVIKESPIEHVVTFVVHKQSKTLYYYDSQGIDMLKREKKIRGDIALKVLGLEILTLYHLDFLRQIPARQQNDIHNCGVYVLYFLKLMKQIKSFSFEDIWNILDKISPMQMRKELMQELLEPMEEIPLVESDFEVIEKNDEELSDRNTANLVVTYYF